MSITASEMGNLSWEKRKKDPHELQRLKDISKLGVEARKKRREAKSL